MRRRREGSVPHSSARLRARGGRALAAVFVISVASAASVALLGSTTASCSSDDANPAPLDSGPEGSLLHDSAPADRDADPPPGDTCGDARGLASDAPWPLRGGCPKRGGVIKGTAAQVATIKWSVPMPSADSSPAIDSERLVWFGTTAGDVAVLTPGGTLQGTAPVGGAVRSSPAVAATRVTVIGGGDGSLYGVVRGAPIVEAGDGGDDDADTDADADGGRPARVVFKLDVGPITSSPVVGGDGTIYVGTNDGELVAVAPDGSAVKWRATTNDAGGSSPAIAADGTIYVGSTDKHLYAIDPGGNVKWSFEAGGEVGSPAVGGDETVYAGAADGKLYAVTPDGKLRFAYQAGGPITGTPAVLAGVAYVGSADQKLHAVSVVDGTPKWTYATQGAVATPVIGDDGTVYVGSKDGKLYAITKGGSLFWAVNVKGHITCAPAIGDDGTIYVTTDTAIVAIGS